MEYTVAISILVGVVFVMWITADTPVSEIKDLFTKKKSWHWYVDPVTGEYSTRIREVKVTTGAGVTTKYYPEAKKNDGKWYICWDEDLHRSEDLQARSLYSEDDPDLACAKYKVDKFLKEQYLSKVISRESRIIKHP